MFHFRVLAVILAVSVLTQAACSVSIRFGGDDDPYLENDPGKYENGEIGFRFDYPDEWKQVRRALKFESRAGEEQQILTRVAIGVFLESEVFQGLVVEVGGLRVVLTSSNTDEFFAETSAVYTQLAGQAGGELVSSGRAVLAGQRAANYVIDSALSGEPIRSEFTITARGNQSFMVLCQAPRESFDDVRSKCAEAIETWEFIDPAN